MGTPLALRMSELWQQHGPLAALTMALAIDVLWGELPNRIHPVVYMGNLINTAVRLFPREGRTSQLLWGGLLALGLPSLLAWGSYELLELIHVGHWLHWAVEGALLTTTFAIRELWLAARRVRDALNRGDLRSARFQLRSLCSRTSDHLTESQLAAATVESLAENASDSITAPLFYYALFGLPGAVFYRAVNTLDAMLGYRDHREYSGKASARLDDLLNWLPARITASIFLVVGPLCGGHFLQALRIWFRDAPKTDSPNAGRPMACMAGLLGVRLEKSGQYCLGDPVVPLTVHSINKCWRIVRLACLIGYIAFFLAQVFVTRA